MLEGYFLTFRKIYFNEHRLSVYISSTADSLHYITSRFEDKIVTYLELFNSHSLLVS